MTEDINASTKLKEILKNFPELTDYLLDMGICGCGDESLEWTVARAAAEKGLNLDTMLNELQRKIKN